nr:immunoglobulin superfamily member 1-like [Zootoca vivipara]
MAEFAKELSNEGHLRGFSAIHDKNKKTFNLEKAAIQLNDSAAYFCAVSDTLFLSSYDPRADGSLLGFKAERKTDKKDEGTFAVEKRTSQLDDAAVYFCVVRQLSPKPSISAVPTNVVSLGGNIILRCASTSNYHQNAIYYVHKEGGSPIHDSTSVKRERDALVFKIANASYSDGGTYTCSYCFPPAYDRQCSYHSDPVRVYIKGQLYPKPSIAVNSAEMLAEEGNVKISCKAENNLLLQWLFFLYIQMGANRQQKKLTEKIATKEAVFAFDNAQEFQGGLYQCRYCFKTAFVDLCSGFSDSRRINRINPSLSKPSIKVLPDKHISPGQNITIECQGPEKGLNFSLYKSGELITSQLAESEGNRAEFPFLNVESEDEGNYTCQYHRWGNPFAWSETSNATELVVRADTFPSMEINIRLGVAGLVLLSLVLIVAEFMWSQQG